MKERTDRRATRLSLRPRKRIRSLILLTLALSALVGAQTGATRAQDASALKSPANVVESNGKDETPARLQPGVPVMRELEGGATHTYLVTLEAGQFLRVVVEQQGVDVGLTFFSPRGERLVEVDSPNGLSGPEPLFFIADAGGTYRLEILSFDKKAKGGRYEARLEELRAASPADRKWMEAYRLFADAETWRLKQTLEARRESIGKYGEALRVWREAGDRAREAQTLSALGWLYDTLAEWQQALDAYEAALPLWRALGDRKAEADTLSGIGWIYYRRGEQHLETNALPRFEQALALQRAAGDHTGENLSLNRIGNVYLLLDRRRQALEFYTQALELSRRTGNLQAEATALGNLAWAYARAGEPERALSLFGEALRLYRSQENRRQEVNTLGNLGLIHAAMRDQRKALEYYEQALTLNRSLGDRSEEVRLLYTLASSYAEVGDSSACLRYAEESLLKARAINTTGGQAHALHALARCHAMLGDKAKALDLFRQALSLKRVVGDRTSEHATLYQLSLLEADGGDVEQARLHVEQALEIAESLRAETSGSALRASFFSTVQEYYTFRIDLLMRQHAARPGAGHDAAAFEASERKRARSLLDSLAEAGTDIRQGVDAALLEREQKARKDFNVRSVELNKLNAVASKEAAAVESAERKLAEALAELQTAEARVRAASPRYAALARPEPLDVRQIQTQLLDADTALIEYSLGPRRSYAFVVTDSTLDAYELPKGADIEEAAREVYGLLTARYPVRGETSAQYGRRVAGADARYEVAAAKLSRMVLAPLSARLGMKRLLFVADGALQYVPFAALPAPQSTKVGITSPETKSKTDEARGVASARANPENRTPVFGTPLIIEHEIASLPSASALAALRRNPARAEAPPASVAVFADPVFSASDTRVKRGATSKVVTVAASTPAATVSDRADASMALRAARDADTNETNEPLPRLAFSREEAAAITSLSGAEVSRRFVDFAASRAVAISGELSRYRYIHFATHSFINSHQPELSGIVLSLVDEQGREQDGFLRLQDIYQMHLPAELVVLSACRTALGKEVRGEGMMSLTRGFIYAGSRRVVASMWKVDDAATSELMERFYGHMLGGPTSHRLAPAAALRQAQLEVMRRPNRRAPFYWAAFALQGEWR